MSVKVKDRHLSKQDCLYKARELVGYILVLTRPREFDKDGKQIWTAWRGSTSSSVRVRYN